jgi:hypothetical protein
MVNGWNEPKLWALKTFQNKYEKNIILLKITLHLISEGVKMRRGYLAGLLST